MKTSEIKFRVTPDDKALFESAALKDGKSLSEWCSAWLRYGAGSGDGILSFTVTEEEFRKIGDAALLRGMSISEYVLSCVLKKVTKSTDLPESRSLGEVVREDILPKVERAMSKERKPAPEGYIWKGSKLVKLNLDGKK